MTVEMWVNLDSAQGSQYFSSGNYGFGIETVKSGVTQIGISTKQSDVYGAVAAQLSTGWHYVSVQFAAGHVHNSALYVDGVQLTLTDLLANQPSNSRANFNGGTSQIGGYATDPQYSFAGLINSVRIFHGQHDASQVLADMNADSVVGQAGLVAEYNFDQVTAGTGGVHDYPASSSGNCGT